MRKTTPADTPAPLPAVILAGGAARRMGGADKLLLPLGGGTILDAILDRLAPQVALIAVNTAGDPGRLVRWDLPVWPDRDATRPGPLAGVLAAMAGAEALGAEAVVTVPCDVPFLPRDLVQRLRASAPPGGGAVAAAAVPADAAPTLHPACALWPVAWRKRLERDLAAGVRRLGDWAQAMGAGVAVFPAGGPDPFLNVNTPEDLAVARARAAQAGG